MRLRLLGVSIALAVLAGCRSEGRVSLKFTIDLLPAELDGLFLHVRVRDEGGEVLGGSIVAAAEDRRISLSIPHGDRRVAVVELRDTASPTASNVIAYGVSAPFSFQPGDALVQAVVTLRRVPAIVDLVVPAVVADPVVPISVTVDRGDIARVVVAQDPSLSFGRQVFDVAGEPSVRYDLDAACRPTNACADGRRTLFARVVDDAGYSSTATSTPIVVDTQSPAVLPGSGAVRFVAPNALLVPSAASAGVVVRLTFVFDEPVTSTPSVTLESGLPFELVSKELGAYTFERVVTDADPAGRQRPVVQARDGVGNDAPRLALDLEYDVDHVRPAPPQVDAPGAIVYHRTPYVSAADGGPSFRVVGGAGAVEGGARVVVYDRAIPFVDGVEVASRAGAASAAADGSFVVELAPVDLRVVHLLVLDVAGNAASEDSHASRVRDVRWSIAAGGAGGTEPPIDVFAVDRRPDSARLDQAGVDAIDDTTPLARPDGAHVVARYDPRWTEHVPIATPVPDELRFAGVAEDPVRARLVVHGGRSATDNVRGDTWEWDGRRWESFAPGSVRPTCDDGTTDGDDPFGSMFHDGALELALIVCRYLEPRQAPPLPAGGTDVLRAFGWDGARWRTVAIDASPAPPGRSRPAFAYDAERGRTVMFGGNTSALVFPGARDTALDDTWELESVPSNAVGEPARLRWIEHAVAGPPARDRHAMVFAPGVGVVMFGGVSAAPGRPTLDDLWIWNGTAWTEIPKTGAWPPPRAQHTMVYDPRSGSIGVIGGVRTEPTATSVDLITDALDDAWWWDGATWTVTATSAGTPSGPGLAVGALRARGDVFALTGVAPMASSAASKTFTVTPSRWSDRTPSGAIPPQSQFQDLMYDPWGDRFWLHTVAAHDAESEVWFWSDEGWRRDEDPPTRPGRSSAGVFDVGREQAFVIALMPGDTRRAPYTRRPGGDWVQTSTTQAVRPSRVWIDGEPVFYDRARDQVVLFSYDGELVDELFNRDTQEILRWANGTWQRADRRPIFDTRLETPALAFDDRTGDYFLQANINFAFATFTFDGTSWTDRSGSEGAWGLRRAIVADEARQRILTIGADGGRARLWSWDGVAYRERTTTGIAPPRELARGIDYDTRRRRVVVSESPRLFTDLQAPAGAVYTLDVDPETRPAIVLRARLGEGDVAPGLVQRVSVDATVGGLGFVATSSAAIVGSVLSMFDRARQRWIARASNGADAMTPAALNDTLEGDEVARAMRSGDAEILLAFEPIEGLGSGDEAPRVEVDHAQLVVEYRLPASP